jgi:hypothetical protein
MSFHFTFTARSSYSARQQLHEVHAPAAVKALVENALAAIAWPALKPPEPLNAPGMVTAAGEARATRADGGMVAAKQATRKEREVFGVLVEVWGHIAEGGGGNEPSEIQRFVVRPLFDYVVRPLFD